MAALQPVSASFIVSPGSFGEQVRRVLAAIDAVHRAGPLPSIPIDEEVGVLGPDGRYRFHPRRGQAHGIGLNPRAPHLELTLLHEVGHFLDHQALGRPGSFASRRHPELEEWRQAVNSSAADRGIRDIRRLTELRGQPVEHITYLLDPSETWARSYAQYVTLRSGEPTLARQLAVTRRGAPPYHLAQWQDGDFEPDVAALDVLLRRKGWIS